MVAVNGRLVGARPVDHQIRLDLQLSKRQYVRAGRQDDDVEAGQRVGLLDGGPECARAGCGRAHAVARVRILCIGGAVDGEGCGIDRAHAREQANDRDEQVDETAHDGTSRNRMQLPQ